MSKNGISSRTTPPSDNATNSDIADRQELIDLVQAKIAEEEKRLGRKLWPDEQTDIVFDLGMERAVKAGRIPSGLAPKD